MKKLIYIGKTKPRISTRRSRLIPKSLSTVPKGSDIWMGSSGNVYEIELSPKAKLLHINLGKFYRFGKPLDTPINRGKLIAKYARKNKYNVVVLDKRIYGLNEYAILSFKAIATVEKK